MLEITVKTLDGRNRTFNVEDDITVKQFKETIASSIEIGADVQRLIFRGKVLVDDKKINDYDVNGQTLHVVQRAPPQTAQSGASEAGQSSSTSNSRRNGFELHEGLPQGIHIEMIPEGGIINGSGAPAQSESRKRINQATRMLNMAKDVLSGLEASSDNTPTTEKMETDEPSTSQDSSGTASQQAQQPEEEPSTDPPSTALADLLEEVLRVNGRMEDHIRQYRDIMRNPAESSQDAQSLEAVCQGTSKAMHLMSHVYHNLSDLFCDFGAPEPRTLRAFSPPMRQATTIIQQTIPVQVSAQFNVSPVLRENATPSSCPSSSSSAPASTTSTMASSATPTTTTTSSASSNFNPSSFFSELNRLVGGEVPNIHFGSGGGGTTQSPQGLGRAFQMFMEMGPNGNISTSTSGMPPSDQAPPASASSTAQPTSASSTTQPTTGTTSNSSEPNTGRSANVTSTSGSTPGFLSDDFLQNIIQVATGVALQNGAAAQRPHLVMLGPQLFMGSGQRGQTSQRRRGARRANDGSTPANAPEASAGAPSATGTPRNEQQRRFREIMADPCLPCNSWHFGHRAPTIATASAEVPIIGQQSVPTSTSGENARRATTNESGTSHSLNRDLQNLRQAMGTLQELTSSLTRATSHIPSNQGQTPQQPVQSPTSLESVITRVLETAQQGNSIESILNALGTENGQSEGLLSDLIACLAPHITFVDMFNLVLGQNAPLRKLRQPLQNFVRDSLLDRRPPTDENIATAVEAILAALRQDIREVSACVEAKEDIDFAASLRAFLRHHLRSIIELIINATDDTAFGEQLHASLNDCLHSLVNLCRFCLRDEDRAIEAMIQNRISIYDDSNPMFRPFMTQWMTQFLQSKLPTIPRSCDDVLVYVVRRPTGDRSEVEREADAESSESFESASANTLDEKMEEETPSPRMMNGQMPFEALVPIDGHLPRLSEEVVSRLPPPPSDDFEVDIKKEGDDDGWKSVVPKEWVPVIAKDSARQRRQALDSPREPLSDAYLCGVPAKRRKLMMKEKNHGTTQSNAQLNNLSDSIRQAANQVNSQPITSFQDVRADLETSHNLLSAYREELARSAEAAKDKFDAPGN